ncbi:MAG: NAD(P)/FAD-dependent oxidoreductase [Alphaproteobacteria bacterium]|nr:NAD(P)/FAD-dependent oxidoreductase [Alphaproteobacteria bacterium]
MTSKQAQYDAIVIGGGVNGLATAAYLQKSGLKTAVFERRDESGTFCSTEEVLFPGVKLNMHASLMLAHYGPAYVDLELERFGLELLRAPGARFAYFYPFLDGNAVLFSGGDVRETYEAWKRISPQDAETLRRISNYFGAGAPILQHMSMSAHHTDESFLQFLEENENIPVFPKDWIWMTGVEFADSLFVNEQIKIAVLSYASTSGLDGISSRITGPLAVMNFLTMFTAEGGYTARGGSHNLTHALVRCFVHHGGRILYNCPVEKVIIENNRACGIRLSKHATYPEAEFRATRAVISDVSAKPTFFNLVGEEHLSASARAQLKRFDYRGSSLFTNYYVLNEKPNFAAAKKFPEVNDTFVFNFGAESMADVGRLIDACMVRNVPPDPPIVWGAAFNYCIADPTQAPPGYYTLLTWAMVPYELRPLGGPEKWDQLRESYADKVEDVFAQYLPNLKTAKVARYVNTPHDYVRRNPHCGGNMHPSGAVTEGQMWSWKPFSGCGAPKTPIDSFYICQSGPAANYTNLGAAYAAASEVMDDLELGRPEWWRGVAFQGAAELLRRRGVTQRFTVD